jgi:Zn-dependent M16 (insulinase) family peptidase
MKDFNTAEKVIFDTLHEVRNSAKLFEQTLHEIEFGAKKTRANTGLMFISHLVPYALHDGDPLTVFKVDEFSKRIREDFNKGGLFEGLIEKHLIKNSHFLRLYYTPDSTKADKDEAKDKR